jgi:hypothetical protein
MHTMASSGINSMAWEVRHNDYLWALLQVCKPHCVGSAIHEALPWGRAKRWMHDQMDAAFDAAADLAPGRAAVHRVQQSVGYAAARCQRAGRELMRQLQSLGKSARA